jgi:hypothetical protein
MSARVVLIGIALVGAALGLTACTQGATVFHLSGVALVDPSSEIRDPHNSRYLAISPEVILHKSGTGRTSFPLKIAPGTTSVQIYLSCTPGSKFKVAIGIGYSGGCTTSFVGYADIPITAHNAKDPVVVSVDPDTDFDLLVIRTPSS